MRTKSILLVAFSLVLGGGTASATTILNTNNADGDANYVGALIPGSPADPTSQAAYITYLISLAPNATSVVDPVTGQTYTRSDLAGPFATVVTPNVQKQEYDDNDPSTILAAVDFVYLIGKFDGQGGGSLVWYLNGVAGETYELPKSFAGKNLSQITTCNGQLQDVPDGGATIGLLGLAMFGVGYLRHRLS